MATHMRRGHSRWVLACGLVLAAGLMVSSASGRHADSGPSVVSPLDGAVVMTAQPVFTARIYDYSYGKLQDFYPGADVATSPDMTSYKRFVNDVDACVMTRIKPATTYGDLATYGCSLSLSLPPGTYYWQFSYETAYPGCDSPAGACEVDVGPMKFTVDTSPNFSMSALPTVSAPQGGTAAIDVSLTGWNGFNSSITVGVNGLPAGAVPGYKPGAAGIEHIRIAVSPTVATGTYPLTITGTGGGLTHTVATTLTITQMPAPVASAPPRIIGLLHVGSTLRSGPGSWNVAGLSYAYQWERCDPSRANCRPISGATGGTYKVEAHDVGHTISVTVVASDPGGTASASALPAGPIPGASATHKARPRKGKGHR